MPNPMRQNVNTWNKANWWGNVQPLLDRIINEQSFTHRFTYQGTEYKVIVHPDRDRVDGDREVTITLQWRSP
jgi:hypothetical protein